MSWPYAFLDLNQDQKHARRDTLDFYAAIAHWSTIIPVLLLSLYRLATSYCVSWRKDDGYHLSGSTSKDGDNSAVRGAYSAVPGSPSLKQQRQSAVGGFRERVRRWEWWLGDDFVFWGGRTWGQRDQVVFGGLYAIWLLALCFVGVGDDYLHLTKRFGIIAVSQFPLQYALSLKLMNPVAYAFHSSHERVNRLHRPLGRIIYGLLVIHAILYFNFYYQTGVLSSKFTHLVPVLGMLGIAAMTLLMSTSLAAIREWSYRLFFVTHLFVSLGLPVAIFFHAHSAKILVVESFLIFVGDIGVRKLTTHEVATKVTRISGGRGTDSGLLRLDLQFPNGDAFDRFLKGFGNKSRTGTSPAAVVGGNGGGGGQHVYLNIPHAARPTQNFLSPKYLTFEFLFSPFSIADVAENGYRVTLVARMGKGPMTRTFARLADGYAPGESSPSLLRRPEDSVNVYPKIGVQGPFGYSRRFTDLAGPQFSAVLLVAGGVGATFIMPIYRELKAREAAMAGGDDDDAAGNGHVGPKVKMVWSMRNAAEATWAITKDKEMDVMADENVEMYLTGNIVDEDATSENDIGSDEDDIPMSRLDGALRGVDANKRRPNLTKIVDDVFKKTSPSRGRVAVVVCGPQPMAKELRAAVGEWVVGKGRDVWWWDEGFGW